MGGDTEQNRTCSKPPTGDHDWWVCREQVNTTSGKLALSFRTKGHRPLLVATDIYRPAAIKQLTVVVNR